MHFRAGKLRKNRPQRYQSNDQNQHQGDGAEFLLREVDQDFFAQPGAQQANDHQERKVDEVVLVNVPVAPVDDGSGEVDDEIYERGGGNKHALLQVEGRHGEAPNGPSGPQQPGRESGKGAAHYGIAQGGFEDELLFDQKQ